MFATLFKGAPLGNMNWMGGKPAHSQDKWDDAESLLDNLEKVIPGLSPGRASLNGHPVTLHDGDPTEGVNVTGVDKDATTGALKYLRGKGFPVKRHNDTEFTIGGSLKKSDGLVALLKFNPNHGKDGRFTDAKGATFMSIGGVFDRQKSRIREKDQPTAGNSARDINEARSRGLRVDFTADQWMSATKGKMRVRDLIKSALGAEGGGGKLIGSLTLKGSSARLDLNNVEAHGALFTRLDRTLNFSKGEAKHSLMIVDKATRGAGAVKRMYRELLPEYEKAGIKKISLTANMDAGAYAWGKYGFKAKDPGQFAKDFRGEAQRIARTKLPGDAKKDLAAVISLTQMVENHPHNTHILTDVKAEKLDRFLNQGLPRSQWRSTAKRLASDLTWEGELDLKDEKSVARLKKYIGK